MPILWAGGLRMCSSSSIPTASSSPSGTTASVPAASRRSTLWAFRAECEICGLYTATYLSAHGRARLPPSRNAAVRPGTTPGCACARTGSRSSARTRWCSWPSPASRDHGLALTATRRPTLTSAPRPPASITGSAPTSWAGTCWCEFSTAGAFPSR